ncbi:hypothetical protein F441_09606 [Phytophthora nicotianae CJ01A1]|uniref:Uncharacterized protein n=5 Tax=Phytophthora nicotianae TaxID=4792 RepID=V9FQ42_PHYNI|nr:hypothetical protein F443_03467 [Phytophthora nicotianae P1569]ETK79232.1 hypothetical protein L915_14893 [Phytophthora nicotianae]ETO58624.1 hypothetical protein F444_22992 [Phytophthora nicotianae P1976]ETP15690.1 hypothetical protein F441_09606 [Phytophthora nicotianae CJ01A1]ETP28409.1 hypothetical protein F442_22301 [Phytophthora nicotianae P10297]
MSTAILSLDNVFRGMRCKKFCGQTSKKKREQKSW